MTTGFGADPLKDGNGVVTVGTTAEDIRQITGSLYSAGLISGGVITTSPTALTYTVSAGVAAFPIVTDTSTPYKPQNQRTVLGPIPATTLTTTAPTSGTRTDIVYAKQLTPAADGDANIVVGIATTLPARAVALGTYTVTAGNTNSNAFTKTGSIVWSIPYGASLGRLVGVNSYFNSTFGITTGNPTGRSTVASGAFYLPTDRLLSVQLTVAVSANGAVGFDNSKYCEAGYDVFWDNNKLVSWTTMGLHQAWQEVNWDIDVSSNPGSHTIRVEHYRAAGPGTPRGRGLAGAPYARLMVTDIGPIA
jgi:hypothetical protein